MTKGFKDKDGKFRPTGNSSNGVSSDSVGSNNIKKYTEPFPKLLPRTDEEKWNNYIKEEGRYFGDFALRMDNILDYGFKKKLISKDDFIEMIIGLTEKQFMKDYGEAEYYADGSFRYTYPKFVKRSEFVFDSSEFEIHASYITTDEDDENEETETGIYSSMEFYNDLSTSMFQELQETQWKNLPAKWKKLISRDMDHPIYAEDDDERW